MISRAADMRYSKALFMIDVVQDKLEHRLSEFEAILSLLKEYPKLMKFLIAPQISVQAKQKLLETCLKGVDALFLHFLAYLTKKRKLRDLPDIAFEYRLMVDSYLKICEADTVTAVPMAIEIEKKLHEKLKNFFQKKVKINQEVDSKIIGGLVLVVGSEMIDWSVKGRLRKLKESLLAIKL